MAWEFWVDRGGTFTDIVAQDPAGALHSHKLLSENPEQYIDAAVAGIRHILADTELDEADIAAVKMGTTVATNALLERRGARVLLMITEGLGICLKSGIRPAPICLPCKFRAQSCFMTALSRCPSALMRPVQF